jgi:hypothetical protein
VFPVGVNGALTDIFTPVEVLKAELVGQLAL